MKILNKMALSAGTRIYRLLASKIPSSHTACTRHMKRWIKPTLIEFKKRNDYYSENTDRQVLLERQRRSGFVEWNQDAEIYAFAKRLQEDFQLDLLSQAFVHRSYLIKEKQKLEELEIEADEIKIGDNKELAEGGEALISDYVWNYFCHFLPRFPLEGIQCIHDHLTSTEVLAHISKNLGTKDIIMSGDYPVEDETHATTIKAIVGALLRSQGKERADLLVRDLVVTQIAGMDVNDFLPIEDYFEVVKDILAREGMAEPEPRIICQTGVNTVLANYHIGMYSDKQFIGHGSGETQETGIQMASLDVLKRLFHTMDSAKPFRYDVELKYDGKIGGNLSLREWSSKKFESAGRIQR